jgi:hypothetical protein
MISTNLPLSTVPSLPSMRRNCAFTVVAMHKVYRGLVPTSRKVETSHPAPRANNPLGCTLFPAASTSTLARPAISALFKRLSEGRFPSLADRHPDRR